ncbi:MAG: hypothetical protein KFF77_03965 [Bacteroidetes bacterium]|nr:hypothetical protein [Bacteroidota bacterium]
MIPSKLKRGRTCSILATALAFVVLTGLNMLSKREAAELPAEFRRPYMLMQYESENAPPAPRIIRFEGDPVSASTNLSWLLTEWRAGDTVNVVTGESGTQQEIVLVRRFSTLDMATYLSVGAVFLLFALVVTLRYRDRGYAPVLLGVATATAAMVLTDWGTLTVHGPALNLLLRAVFDVGIWTVPALFFRFSCSYPREKGTALCRLRVAFTIVAVFGVITSLACLAAIFLFGVHVGQTPYVALHGMVNDVFIIVGLLATVANFEHSALIIRDAHERKNVYWVLLGVIFGPLVYVFLILVPRILAGGEFVSDTVMEYTLLFAPIMFLHALRREGNRRDL